MAVHGPWTVYWWASSKFLVVSNWQWSVLFFRIGTSHVPQQPTTATPERQLPWQCYGAPRLAIDGSRQNRDWYGARLPFNARCARSLGVVNLQLQATSQPGTATPFPQSRSLANSTLKQNAFVKTEALQQSQTDFAAT